jgi:putative tryptophan/tyrosine transport system substrate-binding protein
MRRREFITLVGGGAAAWPLAVKAQQDARIARVGLLGSAIDTVPAVQTAYPFFLAELRKLGFETGRNVLVEYRACGEGLPQATAAVNELVAWKADVIFVLAVEFALKAAVETQRPIPIVMAAINFDPVAKGYVQSLARPGGNITGLDTRWTEITAKQVEVMQEAFPGHNLGVMWDAVSIEQLRAAEREAKAKGLELRAFKLENPPYDLPRRFARWPRTARGWSSSGRAPCSRGTASKLPSSPSSIGCRPCSFSGTTSRTAGS